MATTSPSAKDDVHWLTLRYTETQCPGLHQALNAAPNDQLSALVRGIIYQWFQHHQQAGTLTKAMVATLAGPGATGLRSLRRSSRPRKNTTHFAQVTPLPGEIQNSAPSTSASAPLPPKHGLAMSPADKLASPPPIKRPGPISPVNPQSEIAQPPQPAPEPPDPPSAADAPAELFQFFD